jgi:alpha-tubulin suppressor-like RCC1 family protein
MLAWGQNTVGNLAQNDVVNRSSPTQIGGLANWANNDGQQLNKAGDQGGGALKTDGTLWMWGQNYRGDLGQNAGDFPASRSSPVQVGSDTTWSSWSRGYQGSVIATKTNGTLWGWGNNGTGRLGLNDRTTRSSPAQVGTNTNWTTGDSTKIATNLSAGAINTSNQLFTIGYNNWGELGLNDRAWRSSPTQLPGTWKCIDVEHFTQGGIKTNGTMWTWGQNYYGVLGLNEANPAHKSSPAQVGTDTTWSQFHFGEETAIAIKTNGTLWAWGRNDSSAAGNLGLNDTVQRSSPTQVGTDTTWSQVNGSQARSFAALKTDGSLWVWGNGSGYGNLGLNVCSDNTPYLSSPTQLTGTYQRIISSSRGFAVLKG